MERLFYSKVLGLIVIYFLMNLYVFFMFANLFSLEKGILFYSLFIVSFLSFIIFTFWERIFPNPLTRFFYVLAVSWSGFLLYFICLLLVYNFLNIFFTIPKSTAGITIFFFGCFISICSIINAAFIHVNKIKITVKNLNQPIRIVQISDTHLGTVHNASFLRRVVEKTNTLYPDFVVITGDLIDGTASIKPKVFKILNKIKAPIFMIFGNHEMYEISKVYKMLEPTKIRILRDEVIDFKDIKIIGMDYHKNGEKIMSSLLKKFKLDDSKPKILLYHAPLLIKTLQEFNITLLLSGHLHGGQMFPVNLIAKVGNSHYRGLKTEEGSHIYVSDGAGTWGPPMRSMSKNEITEIELTPDK